MATYRVRSTDGDNADNGSTWALAKADLHTATTGALAVASGAGDEIYVSPSHAQSSTTALTLTAQGTADNPTCIICANDGSDTPTAESTGGTIIQAGSGSVNWSINGNAYWKGLTFRMTTAGTSAYMQIAASTVSQNQTFDNCRFEQTYSGSSSGRIHFGQAGSTSAVDTQVSLRNCVFKFGNTGQRISLRGGRFRWNTGSIDNSGTAPTSLFTLYSNANVDVIIENVDLSHITGSLIVVNLSATGRVVFRNCKLAAGVSVISGTIPGAGVEVILDNCDSGDTHSRSERYTYQGSILADTGTYLTSMTGDSATSPVKLSQKMISLATGPSLPAPLIMQSSKELYKWNETVGSAITATIEILHDSATNLKDDEVWAEFIYMGTSGNPLGVSTTDKKTDYFATGADQDAGTGAGNWTHSMANPNSQKLSATFTVQEKGYISARVHLAKANKTIYVNPDIVVS